MKVLCLNELYEKYGQYEDWHRGGICKGRNCPDYGKCKGKAEFDKLPKRTPIEYEIDMAIARERKFGVWDRETNNY